MIFSIHLLVLILALLLFALGGLGVPEWSRARILAWGLFFWLLSTLIRR